MDLANLARQFLLKQSTGLLPDENPVIPELVFCSFTEIHVEIRFTLFRIDLYVVDIDYFMM